MTCLMIQHDAALILTAVADGRLVLMVHADGLIDVME